MATVAIFTGWIFYGMGAASIIRWANRGKVFPYRMPCHPITPLFFVAAALAIVGNAIYAAIRNPHEFTYLLVAIILMLLGLPGCFFWKRKGKSA